jgi:mono/diheme cytochrome c family protein
MGMDVARHARKVSAVSRKAKWLSCLAGILVLSMGQARAQVPDFERGRLLYENHCVVCHTPKVHRRVPPLPTDKDHLRFIVTVWVRHESMRWSQQDIEDVVHYLDRTYYHPDR